MLIAWTERVLEKCSSYMRDVLHWLPLRKSIEFRIAVQVPYSLIGQASAYLTDLCCPSLSARSTRHLRSAEQCPISCPTLYLLAPPPCTAGYSPWLAMWYAMVSRPLDWLSSHFLEYSPGNSFSSLKQHYLTALGLGALLSRTSPLEEALYKCLQ